MIQVAQTLWRLLADPNISFLLLVLGVWCLVMAVSMPGTGVPEVTAVGSLALAAVGLLQLPVHLGGLLLIGLALVLFILEFQVNAHGALVLSGAVALGLGALLVYGGAATENGRLSWLTVVAAPLLSAGLFGWLIRKGLAAQRAPVLQDPRRLIGQLGVARTAVEREGSVYVAGELWSASAERPIPAETPVVVLDRAGLVLKVAPAPPALHGDEPHSGG